MYITIYITYVYKSLTSNAVCYSEFLARSGLLVYSSWKQWRRGPLGDFLVGPKDLLPVGPNHL